eukprot:Plantae.Rhodophyta-Purpureofilum_apyrenoidigerum.ctg4336.p1 GENE.Plantae.Rhodophyta-Purpureofilum_apyrenoidigerum.ctg4336~~Plantae.Rhodophyta-Purpureofilum_apyrenoidigerum.ctg4336.p1  ORF type:complete len:995 (-),score=223.91 Plantae.Rhodophyta-Purpureofilum_apyrenoidigerum.ctg4336:406-3390(-)
MPEAETPCDLQDAPVADERGNEWTERCEEPDKSRLDLRSYRVVYLDNGLIALLAHDADTRSAAASLDVAVGQFSDPVDMPGLAHFLEHAMFLGTEKYPQEDAFRQFLAENGGNSNAYTSLENTNYHFVVGGEVLPEALDRFSQMFKAPLLTESALDREVQAVDSEAQKNLQSDAHRNLQLQKHHANPDHPFNKFGTGNVVTLSEIPKGKGINPHNALSTFFSKYYSANLMRLVIMASMDLDSLEQLVREHFSDIPIRFDLAQGPPSKDYKDKAIYSKDAMSVEVVPVKDLRYLILLWTLDSFRPLYKSKPYQYIAYLLGHEGPGSLLSLLKKKHWAEDLSAGPDKSTDTFGTFEVKIQLTTQGDFRREDVIELVFSYLKLIRESGVQDFIFEECKSVSEMAFLYREKEDPLRFATFMASEMHHYPPRHYLSGYLRLYNFEKDAVYNMLDQLTPRRIWVYNVSKRFADIANQKEKWYGTDFHSADIAEEVISRWENCNIHDELHVPAPNQFIPSSGWIDLYEVPANNSQTPEVIFENDKWRLHHQHDGDFKRPRGFATFEMYIPNVYSSARNHVLMTLFTLLLRDTLNEFAYDAEIAGLRYDVAAIANGVRLTFQGYTERLEKLVDAVVSKMGSYTVDLTRFELIKEELKRDYRNFFQDQPYEHSLYTLYYLLELRRWHLLDYLSHIDSITAGELEVTIPSLLRKMFVEGLVHGNVRREDALRFREIIERHIRFSSFRSSEMQFKRILQLPSGRGGTVYKMKEPNHHQVNSAVILFYEFPPLGPTDFEETVVLEVLSEIIQEPAFSQLRTQEQLGYIVMSSVLSMENVKGIYVIIQSSKVAPPGLDERVEAFLEQFRTETLAGMKKGEFAKYIKALIDNKNEPDKQMKQRNRRFWSEISKRTYVYDRRENEIEALKQVTIDKVIDAFDRHVALNGPERRKISVQVHGNIHDVNPEQIQEGAQLVRDIPHFKQTCALLPCARSLKGVIGARDDQYT